MNDSKFYETHFNGAARNFLRKSSRKSFEIGLRKSPSLESIKSSASATYRVSTPGRKKRRASDFAFVARNDIQNLNDKLRNVNYRDMWKPSNIEENNEKLLKQSREEHQSPSKKRDLAFMKGNFSKSFLLKIQPKEVLETQESKNQGVSSIY